MAKPSGVGPVEHTKTDSWSFERQPDNGVRIKMYQHVDVDKPMLLELFMTAREWDIVVADMERTRVAV